MLRDFLFENPNCGQIYKLQSRHDYSESLQSFLKSGLRNSEGRKTLNELIQIKNVDIRSYSGPYFTTFGRLRISLYSFRMREKTDQDYFEYGHFSRSDIQTSTVVIFEEMVLKKVILIKS